MVILSVESNLYIEDEYRGEKNWPMNPYKDPTLEKLHRLEELARQNGMNIKFTYPRLIQKTCYTDLSNLH